MRHTETDIHIQGSHSQLYHVDFAVSWRKGVKINVFVPFFPLFAQRLAAASLCTSASPYHEVMRMERRWRSSSEGAGGPRIHGNHRDAAGLEGCGLLKHRNNSSSSKLGSLVSVKVCTLVFLPFKRITQPVVQTTGPAELSNTLH